MVIVMIDKNNTRIMSNIEKTWEDLNIQVDNISEDRKALLIETDHLQLKCFKISWFRSSSLVNAKTRTNIKKIEYLLNDSMVCFLMTQPFLCENESNEFLPW